MCKHIQRAPCNKEDSLYFVSMILSGYEKNILKRVSTTRPQAGIHVSIQESIKLNAVPRLWVKL